VRLKPFLGGTHRVLQRAVAHEWVHVEIGRGMLR
jgi:hypothetical protein